MITREIFTFSIEIITLFPNRRRLDFLVRNRTETKNLSKFSNFITVNSVNLAGTRVAMYIVGQEETVGESSVSSGCWGEDSDHKK